MHKVQAAAGIVFRVFCKHAHYLGISASRMDHWSGWQDLPLGSFAIENIYVL
jgi:hypothetical protein